MLSSVLSCVSRYQALPFNISMYNPIFDSPSLLGPVDNMPIGNGETVANVWVDATNGSLAILLGRSDSLSGYHKALKVGRARVVLDPPLLLESNLAIFKQELILESGSVAIFAQTKSGDVVQLLVWADTNRSFGIDAVHIEINSTVAVTATAVFDPWRTNLISNDTFSARGLCAKTIPIFADTLGQVSDLQATFMYQQNNNSIYNSTLVQQMQAAFAAQSVDPFLGRTYGSILLGRSLSHTHPAQFSFGAREGDRENLAFVRNRAPSNSLRLSLYTNTVIPMPDTPRASDWLTVSTNAVRQYEAALVQDYVGTRSRSAAWWRAYWERSWLVLTPSPGSQAKQAMLSNITQVYLVGRYLSAVQGRLSYNPVHFNGGTLTWGKPGDPDWRPWGSGWWFQNVRHLYWPLLQTGDRDVLASLYGMYVRNIPLYENRAQQWYGHAGMDFVETQYEFGTFEPCDYDFNCDGRYGVPDSNNPYIRHHREGGVELAVILLQHYYTYSDIQVLHNNALPWARSLIKWYQLHYPGKTLYLAHAQACETYDDCNNPADVVSGLTRFAQLLVSLPVSANISDTDRASFQAFQTSLPKIPLGLPKYLQDGGFSKTESNASLSSASVQVVPCEPGFPTSHVNSENTETYALWPYEFFTVNRTEQEQYPLLQGLNTFAHRLWPKNSAWGYDGPDAAVLGLAQEAWSLMHERVFSQGKCQNSRFPAYLVAGTDDGSPQTESIGLIMTILHKAFVQTDAVGSGGTRILLLPAWAKGIDVQFRLHLPLNTTIEGTLQNGTFDISVEPAARSHDLVYLQPQVVAWSEVV